MADSAVARKKIGNKNEKVGEVVSAKMTKTIVVEVTRRVPHPIYKRIINKRSKFYAHDEEQRAQIGDTVRIIECRPMSKLKRWRLGGSERSGPRNHAADGRFEVAARKDAFEEGSGEEVMIGMRTILEVADNSGARKLMCILPRGGDLGLRAGLGDVITASVKEATPESPIKKGKVVRCVIVRMRKESRRKDGTYIRFDSNAAVLINEVGEPVGTRVFGPVARELRDKRFMKIVSLAPEVI
jgi:large subunit ribosomal protein L14